MHTIQQYIFATTYTNKNAHEVTNKKERGDIHIIISIHMENARLWKISNL